MPSALLRVGFFGAFLLMLAATAILAVLGLLALAARRPARARVCALVWGAIAVPYAATLLVASLVSRERVLGQGEEKFFCDVDCDLAYSVTDVRTSQVVGDSSGGVRAHGAFVIVSLRCRSDAARVTMSPHPRARILDRDGHAYGVSIRGQAALEAARGSHDDLEQKLAPGESATHELVFDLPLDARDPKLFVTDGDAIGRFIINDESSPLHRKTLFSLGGAMARLDPVMFGRRANCTLVQTRSTRVSCGRCVPSIEKSPAGPPSIR
jgi:hypothetical protein